MHMKKKKKKPSKRGMKANSKSLHCSSAINQRTSKVKSVAKLLEAVVSVGKNLYKIFAMAKTTYDFVKPYAIMLWEWLSQSAL